MARGQNIQALMLTESMTIKKVYGKGRNIDLMDSRNNALFYRYYFYSRLCKKKYNDVVTLLSLEFFLSEATVGILFIKNAEKLKEVVKAGVSIGTLNGMYPHYKWNSNLLSNKNNK